MADDVYSAWQTYVIIERQEKAGVQQEYFSTGCPCRVPKVGAGGEILSLNGLVFISTALPAPHNTYANFIANYANFVGWLVNTETGEMRYYDGTQADESEYWTAEQRAIGKTNRMNPKNARPVTYNKEMGQMFPASLSAHEHENSIRIEKLFCDKRKMSPSDRVSPVIEQLGFLGTGLVEKDSMLKLIQPDNQDYYMCIFYSLDYSGDADVFARVWISPCTFFESYEITGETENTVSIMLEAKSTYSYTIPLDHGNIVTNSPHN